ncbi:MAG: hypothetical protein GC156_05715 [Actinomycetales bacterium]|nr:hypothetical protein [Actinomycetales bacterium]
MADQNPPESAPPPPPEGAPRGANVGLAMSWAFDRFKANAAAFVGLAAVVTVIQLVQGLGTRPIQNILTDCSNPQTPGQVNACTAAIGVSAVVAIGIGLVFALLAFIAQIGVQRAAIRSTQGVAPTFAEMFTTQYLGRYILFTIVFVILFIVGLALCILPGLFVMFVLQLGPYYILDKGYSVGDAMKASWQAVTRNMSAALLMTVINVLVYFIGGLVFGLLTLVTLPFGALFTSHLYRQFNHEEIV